MTKIRKVLGVMLCSIMLLSQALLVSAAPVETKGDVLNVDRQYFDNGDYIETVISESPIAAYSSSKSGSKSSTYYNASNEALWYRSNWNFYIHGQQLKMYGCFCIGRLL